MLVTTSTVAGCSKKRSAILRSDRRTSSRLISLPTMKNGTVGKRRCISRITRASTVPSPMPASNTRTAGGRGWICPSSRPTRRAMTSFSLHVLTKSRYFWRLSKKRKLLSGSAFCTAAAAGRGAPPWMSAISSGGASPAPEAPCCTMKSLTRVRVSGVTRAPSRRRATNLPSFTARRPKVDSAMPVRRQKSEMLPSSVPPPPACTASSVTELRENLARAISGTSTTPLAVRKLGYCPSRKINGFHSRPDRQYPAHPGPAPGYGRRTSLPQAGEPQPRRLDQGPRRAVDDRGGRARRAHPPGLADRRGNRRQHRPRPRARGLAERLSPAHRHAGQDEPGEDFPSEGARRRSAAHPLRCHQGAPRVLPGHGRAPDARDAGRLLRQPVRQRGQSARA